MAKENQNTIETYYVAVVFSMAGNDLDTVTVKGKNLTAKDAALKGAAKLGGFLGINEDSGYTVEKDHGTRSRNGWKRFIGESRFGEPFEVAVAHKSSKLL
jgi:hypothetical protein